MIQEAEKSILHSCAFFQMTECVDWMKPNYFTGINQTIFKSLLKGNGIYQVVKDSGMNYYEFITYLSVPAYVTPSKVMTTGLWIIEEQLRNQMLHIAQTDTSITETHRKPYRDFILKCDPIHGLKKLSLKSGLESFSRLYGNFNKNVIEIKQLLNNKL